MVEWRWFNQSTEQIDQKATKNHTQKKYSQLMVTLHRRYLHTQQQHTAEADDEIRNVLDRDNHCPVVGSRRLRD